jgi:hypothetical protein
MAIGASTTALDIIHAALRIVGVGQTGEVYATSDVNIASDILSLLLQEWSDGGLVVPSIVQEAITTVAAQNSYTVGKNGSPDLDTVRPEQIIGAWVRDSSNYDYPVEVIGEKAYRKFISKTTQARPEKLWYNPTAPNGTVYVWPTPSAAESLYISSVKPFAIPASDAEVLLNTTSIPSNYHNALRWNLAVEICPEFRREPTMLMITRATDTYSKIESLNFARRMEAVELEISPESSSGRNILTG